MAPMSPTLLGYGFAQRTGERLAEIGFLLMLIAGVWLAAAEFQPRWHRLRQVVAGALLAVGAALLIVAIHWGHFG